MTRRDRLRIGRLGRAHGIRGEVRLFAGGEWEEALVAGQTLHLNLADMWRAVTVEEVRWAARFGILALEEVADRTEAEGLTHAEVYVDAAAVEETSEETFYRQDLVGLAVFVATSSKGDAEGRRVGEVDGFFETGANDVMVVHASTGREFLVPMVEGAVRLIDLGEEQVWLEPFEDWAPADFSLDD